jgi:hypothetical protein
MTVCRLAIETTFGDIGDLIKRVGAQIGEFLRLEVARTCALDVNKLVSAQLRQPPGATCATQAIPECHTNHYLSGTSSAT